MSKKNRRFRGISLLEILVAIAILILVAAVAAQSTGTTLRRQQMINHLRWYKATIVRARSRAIETTSPVRFQRTLSTNHVQAVLDTERTGDFSVTQTVVDGDSPYEHVQSVTFGDSGLPALPHWTGLASQGSVSEFPNDRFVILPDGRVFGGNPATNRSGTFFFKTDNDDMFGAVHVTAMGEIKMAIFYEGQEDSNDWDWTE